MKRRNRDREEIKAIHGMSFATYILWLQERARTGRLKQKMAKIDSIVEQRAKQESHGEE